MKIKKLDLTLVAAIICALVTQINAGVLSVSAKELGYVSEIDKSAIMTVEINADPDVWQGMLDNAEAEEYIPADITINGLTMENVGIRPKGNSSLSAIARSDETDRYSFKIKFDEYVDGQTWLGLDKMVLNSNYSDATSMKEYISYDIMSFIGVDSSLFGYTDVTVNGESWGFYLAVEDVDSGFRQRLKNDEGELYKPESMEMGGMGGGMPSWDGNGTVPGASAPVEGETAANNTQAPANQPQGGQTAPGRLPTGNFDRGQDGFGGGMRGGFGSSMNGVSLVYTDDNISSYSAIFDNAETKTNEADHIRVIEALENLNAGTNLEEYIDVDLVLRYLAAHTVVVNLDSYSASMGHNYLLYEIDGKLSMIPWDYNMAWGGMGGMGGGSRSGGSASGIVNFPIDTPVSGVSMEDRPMIGKLLEVPEYLERYHQYLQEIVDGYFAGGQFEKTVSEIDAMISEYIKNDPSAFFTYEEYQAAVAEFIELGTLRGESVQGQLDGTVPSTTEGQTAEPDKLIDASSVDMSALGDMGGMGGGFDRGDFDDGDFRIPGMPEGFGMEEIRQAMEIIRTAEDGQLTEEQKTALRDLGLDDEQIEQIMTMINGGPGGGFGW